MSIIEVKHVTKEFALGQLPNARRALGQVLARLKGQSKKRQPTIRALDDVTFSVASGEVLGIIGHNGAGKSTLLKLLASITTPSHGEVVVAGRVAPLIEVGAGLVPDLTGRENVFLNGIILGMNRSQIRRKFDEIVSFAELEKFVDTPIKRYSSGMQVRLAFSIATAVDADILIIDEVLAVGDLAFQRKCFDRMEDLIRRRKNTVLLVSHNLRHVERLCSRVLLLESGRIVEDGTAKAVCDAFYRRLDDKILNGQASNSRHGRLVESGEVELLECQVQDTGGVPTRTIAHGNDLVVRLRLRVHTVLPNPVFGIGFHTADFVYLSTSHSVGHLEMATLKPGEHELSCRFANVPLLPGVYSVRVGVAFGAQAIPSFYGENLAQFQVTSSTINRAWDCAVNEGFFSLDTAWTIRGVPAIVSRKEDLAALNFVVTAGSDRTVI